VMMKMCQQVPNLKYLDSLSLFNGDKKFSFYKASSAFSLSNDKTVRAKPCPFPPRAWIDSPLANAQLTGMSHIAGWAYVEDIGIESISLLIEGVEVGVLSYGISRPDVAAAMSVKTDPNSPRLGFSYEFDTATMPNGSYSLAIRITDKKGQSSNYRARQISVEN
jgi:hypothetical protein